jgi:hypothetical protein
VGEFLRETKDGGIAAEIPLLRPSESPSCVPQQNPMWIG